MSGSLLIDEVLRPGTGIPGANIAVAAPLATTAASVSGNLATFTMSSNPITAGFAVGKTIMVAGFTGGDTFFNAGTVANNAITGGYTILSVTSTTVVVALVHASASASSNGTLLQIGDSTTPCAGLVQLYTDSSLTTTISNPTTSDTLGNYDFGIAPGVYYVQIYGNGITTKFNQVIASFPSSAAVGGSTNDVQYNDTGSFAGSALFTFNPTATPLVGIGDSASGLNTSLIFYDTIPAKKLTITEVGPGKLVDTSNLAMIQAFGQDGPAIGLSVNNVTTTNAGSFYTVGTHSAAVYSAVTTGFSLMGLFATATCVAASNITGDDVGEFGGVISVRMETEISGASHTDFLIGAQAVTGAGDTGTTVTNQIGFRSINRSLASGSPVITNSYNFRADAFTATISALPTNNYGFYSQSMSTAGSTLTAAFYAEDQGTGAGHYSIFSAGGLNSFAGGLNIGGVVLSGTNPLNITTHGTGPTNRTNSVIAVVNSGGGSTTYFDKSSTGRFRILNDAASTPAQGNFTLDPTTGVFMDGGSSSPQFNLRVGAYSRTGVGDNSAVVNIFKTGSAPHVFAVTADTGTGDIGSIIANPFTNDITFYGNVSGNAAIGTATAAGTPNKINLPTTTAASSGLFLISDGGSPQQTSWTNVMPFVSAPATASSTGTTGQIAFDSTHFYVCIGSNTWVRGSLATF